MVRENIYISRCIELAKKAGKHTLSNPMVGSVIVYNDTIIGEGYHEKYGGPHAEVNAINSVKEEDKKYLKESTIYISLEPCNNYGKTPPCVGRIIDSQFKKVVIGCIDPNPRMNGKSVEILREKGIEVDVLNHQESKSLIRKFEANFNSRPYIILKWAQTQDGYIGHKEKQIWLSNEVSKVYSHKWRTEVDAILIGKNTALIDNPQLTPRLYEGDMPIRILLDSNLEVPSDSLLFTDGNKTIVFNTKIAEIKGSVEYIKVEENSPQVIVSTLYKMGIFSVLIEGGKKVLQSFIDAKLWDEARVIQTKKKLEDHKNMIAAPAVVGSLQSKIKNGDDEILIINKLGFVS